MRAVQAVPEVVGIPEAREGVHADEGRDRKLEEDQPVTKYDYGTRSQRCTLEAILAERHNAMLADQAAEAINDFRVALAMLCDGANLYQRDWNDVIRGLR